MTSRSAPQDNTNTAQKKARKEKPSDLVDFDKELEMLQTAAAQTGAKINIGVMMVRDIMKQPCHFCHKMSKTTGVSRIVRMDRAKGWTFNNCRPGCGGDNCISYDEDWPLSDFDKVVSDDDDVSSDDDDDDDSQNNRKNV
jgi:hypothetical protein